MTKKEVELEVVRLKQKIIWLEGYMQELLAENIRLKTHKPLDFPFPSNPQIPFIQPVVQPQMPAPYPFGPCQHFSTVNSVCVQCGMMVYAGIIITSGTEIKL